MRRVLGLRGGWELTEWGGTGFRGHGIVANFHGFWSVGQYSRDTAILKMIQKFLDFEFREAELAAKVISYITGDTISITRLPLTEHERMFGPCIEWEFEHSLPYEAALVILSFELPPPSGVPEWWEEAKVWFMSHLQNEDFQKYIELACKAGWGRKAGESPCCAEITDGYQKSWAFNEWQKVQSELSHAELEKEQRLAAEEDAYYRSLTDDPNYLEDIKHARRAAYESEVANSSDSAEEFAILMREYDARNT